VTLDQIAQELGLDNRTDTAILNTDVTGGYTGDLLSCTMARAQEGNVWITIQAHPNIVAVASLLGLSGIIIAEGVEPSEATIEKAKEHAVPILTSPLTCFTLSGKLFAMGVRGID